MLRLADTVSTHTHIRLSARRLKAAIRLREQVREAAIDFENIAWQATDSMSPALRDIIMESAWYRAVWFITMCLTSGLLLTTIGDRRVT